MPCFEPPTFDQGMQDDEIPMTTSVRGLGSDGIIGLLLYLLTIILWVSMANYDDEAVLKNLRAFELSHRNVAEGSGIEGNLKMNPR